MNAAAAPLSMVDQVAEFTPRKLDLIEGAAEVFARAGYHGCSMRDIAERIGIRQSSIYHHFRSKDEILEAICTYGGERFLRNIQAIRAQDKTPLAKLATVVRTHIAPFFAGEYYANAFVFIAVTSR
ncbi:MAG: helix-turn-helix domain-containing protein [Burkholderiales bacterium]